MTLAQSEAGLALAETEELMLVHDRASGLGAGDTGRTPLELAEEIAWVRLGHDVRVPD